MICRRNATGNTIHSYRDAVKLFLQFVTAKLKRSATKLRVADITESLVLDFLSDLERTRGNSVQTRNHRLVAIRCLFEHISAREPLLIDHCRRIVTIPAKRGVKAPQICYLTKEEIESILQACDRRDPLGRRDYALILFMYNTGARVQEASDVRVSWLSLDSPPKVEILGKGRKWRTCPLWEHTARVLREFLSERGLSPGQDDHLFLNRFSRPISRFGIADAIRKRAVRAAPRTPSLKARRVTPHTIRHTTAMHLLQSGVDVNVIRSWLGHASIATTNLYVEIDLEMKTQILKACEVRGRQKPKVPSWRSKPDILRWLESL
jgi:site-specific recombinase XerD